jgi:hypothetical protein
MKKRQVSEILLKRAIGREPEPNSVIDDVSSVFNTFNERKNRKDAIGFFEAYMAEKNPEFLKERDYSKLETTVGWIARLLTLNCSLPSETVEWFNRKVDAFPAATAKPVANMASVRDSLEIRTIAEIEEKFDRNETESFDWLKGQQLPKSVIKAIDRIFRGRLEELDLIDTDDQVREAFSVFTPKEIKGMKDSLSRLLNVFGSTEGAEEVVKRGRQSKIKTAKEIAQWMTVAGDDADTGLKGLPAEKIVGATTVVVYRPDHRTLTIFTALEGKTLTVKGKSIMNHDPEKSFAKSVRNPEKLAAHFLVKNHKRLMAAFETLNTKARPQTTSLISANHMLISAF